MLYIEVYFLKLVKLLRLIHRCALRIAQTGKLSKPQAVRGQFSGSRSPQRALSSQRKKQKRSGNPTGSIQESGDEGAQVRTSSKCKMQGRVGRARD
jgi:hypothetical protein